MRRLGVVPAVVLGVTLMTTAACRLAGPAPGAEPPAARDARMAWWRDARFGLFIHWGLYSIPAGEWAGQTRHAEWIRETAQIPLEQYEPFLGRFNPVKFDARAWVQMAKDAGMKYIVITSKHHDGFCLFDSAYTDFDVMSTPFQRDILKELSDACREAGLKLCWYHSIMDWHHPDYLPRRSWEQRSTTGADYERYVAYMKNQLRELLTNYGPIGVLWFDGEWESTWTHERGVDLYNYVRSLQPNIIINNRVDTGRSGMAGLTRAGGFVGDFGTPEQEIPATGLPDVDWETCMTMNNNWGFNKADHNWKSTADLIRKLVDIASKGGNFLLNVGPTAEGEFPPESVSRLREIGQWMKVNGESIYATRASPFRQLRWGRCTQRPLANGQTRLYLHVFEWPANAILPLEGLCNDARQAHLLANGTPLEFENNHPAGGVVVRLPQSAPDPTDTVVVLDIAGAPTVINPPVVAAAAPIFIDDLEITLTCPHPDVEIRYSAERVPAAENQVYAGPFRITQTAVVVARAYRGGRPVSGVTVARFDKVTPQPPLAVADVEPGLKFEYFEGEWSRLPEFSALSPIAQGLLAEFVLPPDHRPENFAVRYAGLVRIPRDGVYEFFLTSDDGSRLLIDRAPVVDHDGLHAAEERSGRVALAAGLHSIEVVFFQRSGLVALDVAYSGPDLPKQRVPGETLVHAATLP